MKDVTITLYILHYCFPNIVNNLNEMSKDEFNYWDYQWQPIKGSISRNHKDGFLAITMPYYLYVNFNNSFIRNSGEYI